TGRRTRSIAPRPCAPDLVRRSTSGSLAGAACLTAQAPNPVFFGIASDQQHRRGGAMNRETRIEADRAAAPAAPCSRVGVALAALGMLLLCGLPAAADTPRNERPFDGVWLAFSGGAGASPAWPTDKYTPAAKAAIAAFEDKYGPDAPEAGAFCVHAGMPSMMTS